MMHQIGFSCGVLHLLQENGIERFSAATMSTFIAAGGQAVELMCHSTDHLAFLCAEKHAHISRFSHITVHAPAYPYDDDEESHALLQQLARLHEMYVIAYIVVHPDCVKNWDVIAQYKLPIAIENMDDRKKTFRNSVDIANVLYKYPFGLVIDLQHCFVNDPGMDLARELHTIFNDRIVGYHISGYDPQLLHVPLCTTGQDEIIASIQCTDLPVIIESTFSTQDDVRREFAYIMARKNAYARGVKNYQ